MNGFADIAEVELVDDAAQFFAPVDSDVVDGLLGQYKAMRARVERIGTLLADEIDPLHYFLEGNSERRSHAALPALSRLLEPAGAIAALNASYWSKAMALTDVLETMPKARRDEWQKSILEMKTPEFTEDTVRPTILGLLQARERFFAERVDGIFRGLSGEHVTNCPEAFGKRMILAGIVTSYGTTDHERGGLINDFRAVVGKFMGRPGDPGWGSTAKIITEARYRRGEWLSCDGGSWKIRVYKVGTAHLEVHPDMAWRLNCVLAQLHPLAIPAQFRAKPKRKAKDFEMVARPLPFNVIEALSGLEQARERAGESWRGDTYTKVPNAVAFRYSGSSDMGRSEAARVLESIGGVVQANGTRVQFDYDPFPVIAEIVASGCIPDRKAHQFYPTPESVARIVAEMTEAQAEHTVLEPSAGTGNLAGLFNHEQVTCVEISPLHCSVLRAKGLKTIEADFVDWSDTAYPNQPMFDRVVGNPPYSEGRWKLHTEHAASHVKPGGRLVFVLPASARGKDLLPGFAHEWSSVFENEFAGTSASVAVLCATRKAA